MGVSCPQLSDEPSYTMVESSGGGSCRCACQDDFHQDGQDQQSGSGCCSPHVFTSILLGILSCVLMTGGVFLAFHRWDPMWLMVSGVGVVLILIGTILHCCHNISQQRARRHSAAGGKGCCSRPLPPDHTGHVMPNGSLTEQLLPLSNARSVSQLSLNMLPGYFPPVVTAYGIEQHSAVVQNINRLVQQQQQQQQSQNPGSCSPGIASTTGNSFIVLSLPNDTTAANVQNLVATVYQLDRNTSEPTGSEANHPSSPSSPPVAIVKPNSPIPLILKNAEVQTCNIWPTTAATNVASTSGESSSVNRRSEEESSCQTNTQPPVPSTSSGITQTDDIPPIPESINLIDCSSDIIPICDTPTNSCDSQPSDHSALVNIPVSSSSDLLDVPVPSTSSSDSSNSILVDIPETETPSENLVPPTTTTLLLDVVLSSSPSILSDNREILLDISLGSGSDLNGNNSTPVLEDLMNNVIQHVDAVTESTNASRQAANNSLIEMPQNVPESAVPILGDLNSELASSLSNLSADDTEIDDSELMARSSPPPSYDDVTLEGENVGAFGLAYGTI